MILIRIWWYYGYFLIFIFKKFLVIEKIRLQFSIYLQVFQASSKYRLGLVPALFRWVLFTSDE